MTKDDLKQIAELLQNNNKELRKELRQEFSEMLEENNKVLKESIVFEIAEVVNAAFSEFEGRVNEQFAEIKNELETKPSSEKIFTWADNQLIPVQRDVERLKYLHIKEYKDLPDNLTIQSELTDEGLA